MIALDYWHEDYTYKTEVVTYVRDVQYVIAQGRYISLTPVAMPIGEDVVQIVKTKDKDKAMEIYFTFNNRKLRKDEMEKLKTLEPGNYFLVGHADWIGDKDYNYKLSLERAEETKKAMEKLGLKVVEVKGEGEKNCNIKKNVKRITKDLIEQLQPCRKVEIFSEKEE